MYRFTKANRLLGIVALLCCLLSVSAQTVESVSGVIKNEQGETLIGAYVQVLETKEKVITDIDGKFTIKANIGQTLQAS